MHRRRMRFLDAMNAEGRHDVTVIRHLGKASHVGAHRADEQRQGRILDVQFVRDAGFEKETQAIDPWGIFTVSRARRKA